MSEVTTTTVKRGRPVVANSPRQVRLAARQARIEANNGELKRGRPSNPNSARQAKMLAKLEAIQNGAVIKRGRPKVEKVESTEAL